MRVLEVKWSQALSLVCEAALSIPYAQYMPQSILLVSILFDKWKGNIWQGGAVCKVVQVL